MNSRGIRFGFSLLFFALFPLMVLGQDFDYRGEVFGGAGYGKFYDDEGGLGTGLTYRTGISWRFLNHFGAGVELLGIRHTRKDSFHVQGDSLAFFGNAAYYFSRSKTQPYVLGGLGAQRADFTYSWPEMSCAEYQASKTELAYNVGVGIKFLLNRNWSFDPQFRWAFSTPSNYWLVSYLSVALAYHW